MEYFVTTNPVFQNCCLLFNVKICFQDKKGPDSLKPNTDVHTGRRIRHGAVGTTLTNICSLKTGRKRGVAAFGIAMVTDS